MRGQNSMPSHARQVDARDAWSVILYIRDMQKTEPVAPPPATAAPPTATDSGAATARPAGAASSATAPAGPVKGGK
jgi:hypothetical protein